MTNSIVSKRKVNYNDKQLLIVLPVGRIGVNFSNTVPCEISRIDEESPIFDTIYQFLGRVVYHLSIPDKLDIYGGLDHETLETILMAYSNVPNRKLLFINRGESYNDGLVTTTVLRKGPVTAKFRSSKGLLSRNNRVLVGEVGLNNMRFEFPVGHYVQKVIIPNHLVLEGGIRSTRRLRQTLDQFSEVAGRKIIFNKSLPKGGVITRLTLSKGPIGVKFHPDYDNRNRLPIVSTVSMASDAWRLNITHIVEKLIVPNEITIEKMGCTDFERILNNFSEVDGRVIVMQEFYKDISKAAGATATITLPTGDLGIVFHSEARYISVAQVKERSQVKDRVQTGYYVESLFIPGILELKGIAEMVNADILLETLNEFSHIHDRILVLKQCKGDVKGVNIGKQFKAEFV